MLSLQWQGSNRTCLSEEYTSPGIAVCVNVSRGKPHSDTTVILQRGDHSFVTHESVINYQDAREMPIRPC